MKIFAIGDLHLALSMDKPMAVFGAIWENHIKQIKDQWLSTVTAQDLVIVCGDISWAMTLEEAKADLRFLHELPGQKVCIRGNHDYWWDKITLLNGLYEDIHFLQNTAYTIHSLTVCGTRGWSCPNDVNFTPKDQKIYNREVARLKLSLENAGREVTKIVAMHYPPTYAGEATSLFTELLEAYQVKNVVYGHLHDELAWRDCLKGPNGGVDYHLVSGDYLQFKPKLILEI